MKKLFLNISQYLQEKTCPLVSFSKVAGFYFEEHLQLTVSELDEYSSVSVRQHSLKDKIAVRRCGKSKLCCWYFLRLCLKNTVWLKPCAQSLSKNSKSLALIFSYGSLSEKHSKYQNSSSLYGITVAFLKYLLWLFFPVFVEFLHCIKYARIRVLTDSYSSVFSRIVDSVLNTEEYGSVKTGVLSYFMKCWFIFAFFESSNHRHSL